MSSGAMGRYAAPPGLEGLFELDRKQVDIRPTLLRVLTDQYLHSPVHSADDVQHYSELAIRLFDETSIATRAAVAMRLAPHACAPREVMLRLAHDVIEVAEPVLLHSPCLTPEDCETIGRERGFEHARILSMRVQPAAAAKTAPAMPAPPTARNIPAAMAAAADSPHNTDDRAAAADSAAIELHELFFAADSPERRLILLNLDYATWPPGAPPAALQRADIWRIETAALRHNSNTVTRELERALGISHRLSCRVVDDELGEPIVVAAKAMTLPADVLQRIVLFLNPRVGQSVDRVYELSRLYGEISVDAARRMVAIMRAADTTERAAGVTPAASTEAARRPAAERVGAVAGKLETPTLRRAASDR